MARVNTRAAAVTGAGSGLGRDIALGLAAKHYRVFGTAMNAEEIADLQQASGGVVKSDPLRHHRRRCGEAVGSGRRIADWRRPRSPHQQRRNLDSWTVGGSVSPCHPTRVRRQRVRLAVRDQCVSAGASAGARAHRADQHLDGQSADAVQRTIGRIESGGRGVGNRVPRRTEAVRHRRGRGRARQHANGRSSEDGGGPSTSRR